MLTLKQSTHPLPRGGTDSLAREVSVGIHPLPRGGTDSLAREVSVGIHPLPRVLTRWHVS